MADYLLYTLLLVNIFLLAIGLLKRRVFLITSLFSTNFTGNAAILVGSLWLATFILLFGYSLVNLDQNILILLISVITAFPIAFWAYNHFKRTSGKKVDADKISSWLTIINIIGAIVAFIVVYSLFFKGISA